MASTDLHKEVPKQDSDRSDDEKAVHLEGGGATIGADIADLPPDPDAHLSEAEREAIVRQTAKLLKPHSHNRTLDATANVMP